MKKITFFLLVAGSLSLGLQAQDCDPTVAPTGLTSWYVPGLGQHLEWDDVPGSVGFLLRVDLPSGSSIVRRRVGSERNQYIVPYVLLAPGTYTWRVQAACSAIPPYEVTPISESSSFTVGGGYSCPATTTDIDSNVYNTVQIGDQCWMAANLKVERYQNGDDISTGLSDDTWSRTSSGAFAVYDNNAANKDIYGLLYNWYAVNDSRGLCPSGWHVPTFRDWTILTDFLGGIYVAGGKMKATGTLEAGTGLWYAPNVEATNSSGFSGLPGGYRFGIDYFEALGNVGDWWSSSEYSSDFIYAWELYNNDGLANTFVSTKQAGYSVRCLRD